MQNSRLVGFFFFQHYKKISLCSSFACLVSDQMSSVILLLVLEAQGTPPTLFHFFPKAAFKGCGFLGFVLSLISCPPPFFMKCLSVDLGVSFFFYLVYSVPPRSVVWCLSLILVSVIWSVLSQYSFKYFFLFSFWYSISCYYLLKLVVLSISCPWW